MKEKLLGSIVVSHYGPFEKGTSREHFSVMENDKTLLCALGSENELGEYFTVWSRFADDPVITFDQFKAICTMFAGEEW